MHGTQTRHATKQSPIRLQKTTIKYMDEMIERVGMDFVNVCKLDN